MNQLKYEVILNSASCNVVKLLRVSDYSLSLVTSYYYATNFVTFNVDGDGWDIKLDLYSAFILCIYIYAHYALWFL